MTRSGSLLVSYQPSGVTTDPWHPLAASCQCHNLIFSLCLSVYGCPLSSSSEDSKSSCPQGPHLYLIQYAKALFLKEVTSIGTGGLAADDSKMWQESVWEPRPFFPQICLPSYASLWLAAFGYFGFLLPQHSPHAADVQCLIILLPKHLHTLHSPFHPGFMTLSSVKLPLCPSLSALPSAHCHSPHCQSLGWCLSQGRSRAGGRETCCGVHEVTSACWLTLPATPSSPACRHCLSYLEHCSC